MRSLPHSPGERGTYGTDSSLERGQRETGCLRLGGRAGQAREAEGAPEVSAKVADRAGD